MAQLRTEVGQIAANAERIQTELKMNARTQRRGRSRSRRRRRRPRNLPRRNRPRRGRRPPMPHLSEEKEEVIHNAEPIPTTTKREYLLQHIEGKPISNYIAAVIDPFSQMAVGACIPDKNSKETCASCDRITATIDPTDWDGLLYSSQSLLKQSIAQIAFVIVPRCITSGIFRGANVTSVGGTGNLPLGQYTDLTIKYSLQDENGEELPQTENIGPPSNPLSDPYSLMILPINADGYVVRKPSSAETKNTDVAVDVGPTFVKYSRMTKLLSNVQSTRIVGAGIKALPDAPPILTGGYAYGGSVILGEIMDLLASQGNTYTEDGGKFKYLANYIKNRVGYKGIVGVTARYDTLQSNEQKEYMISSISKYMNNLVITTDPVLRKMNKRRKLNDETYEEVYEEKDMDGDITIDFPSPSSTFSLKDTYNKIIVNDYKVSKKRKLKPYNFDSRVKNPSIQVPTATTSSFYRPNNDNDIGVHDLIRPEDQVPILLYKFNTAVQDGQTTFQRYTVELRSRVHAQNVSSGLSPFMNDPIGMDPCLSTIQDYINNADECPIASKGNSFKSIVSKIGKLTAHVVRHASRAQKIMKIIESAF